MNIQNVSFTRNKVNSPRKEVREEENQGKDVSSKDDTSKRGATNADDNSTISKRPAKKSPEQLAKEWKVASRTLQLINSDL